MYCTFLWSESIFDLFANFDMPAVLLDYAVCKIQNGIFPSEKKIFWPKTHSREPFKFRVFKTSLRSKK